jgi:hypothetical protein
MVDPWLEALARCLVDRIERAGLTEHYEAVARGER